MEPSSSTPSPLVSCVLPTKDRATYIPQAIRSYQSQTYPAKELLIVDNGDDRTESLIPSDDPSIRYLRVTGPRTTGEMRNLCGMHARGGILCHFDSDDWSAPERVTDQVTRLGTFGVVTGYHTMFFYDVRDGRCYHWQGSVATIRYALGTSLCYRKEWWLKHPFQSIRIGEDIRFFQRAYREAHRLVQTVPAGALMVARVHDHQTCRKSLTRRSYHRVDRKALPTAFPCGSTSSVT